MGGSLLTFLFCNRVAGFPPAVGVRHISSEVIEDAVVYVVLDVRGGADLLQCLPFDTRARPRGRDRQLSSRYLYHFRGVLVNHKVIESLIYEYLDSMNFELFTGHASTASHVM